MKLNIFKNLKARLEMGETVTAVMYARTSTMREEQKDSCDNQISMGYIYLENHPNIKLVEDAYVDKGISGKSNLKRNDFERMLERVKQGGIDLIIVKNKSRICRSKALSIMLEEMMRDYGFAILTLNDGQIIDYSDRASRLTNGIRDVIDEDYVWGQSEYGKMQHQLRCSKKRLTANQEVIGFRWNYVTKDMEINEEESKYVIMAFEWYVYQNIGVSAIADRFEQLGFVGKVSKKRMTAATITSILTNPAYIGIFYINKKGSQLDLGKDRTTIRFTNPREEWIQVDRPDLAFLDKELFDMAQRIRKEKMETYVKPTSQKVQARFQGFHLFASKVFCASCGRPFNHLFTDRAKTISAYKDCFAKRARDENEVCENKHYNKIHEITLSNITKKAINMTFENKKAIFSKLYEFIQEAIQEESVVPKQDNKMQIAKLEKEKVSYFESWRTAPDDDMREYFHQRIEEIKEQLDYLREQQKEKQDNTENIENLLSSVKQTLDKLQYVEELDRDIVECMVDKIIIHEDGQLFITLKTGPKLTTKISEYKSVAQSLQKGEIVKYIKNLRDFLFFSTCVGRLYISNMMEVCLRDMRTVRWICFPVWKIWC